MIVHNTGRRWLPCEDDFLRGNLAFGWEMLGLKLGRSAEAVETRYKRLRRAGEIAKRRDPRRTRWYESQIGGAA